MPCLVVYERQTVGNLIHRRFLLVAVAVYCVTCASRFEIIQPKAPLGDAHTSTITALTAHDLLDL